MFRMNVNGSYLQWLYSRCLLPSWYRQKRFKLWLHLFFMKMKDQELFRNVLNTSHCLLIVFPVLCAWTCANTVLVLKAFREVWLLKHKEDLKKPASETGWWQQRPRSGTGRWWPVGRRRKWTRRCGNIWWDRASCSVLRMLLKLRERRGVCGRLDTLARAPSWCRRLRQLAASPMLHS